VGVLRGLGRRSLARSMEICERGGVVMDEDWSKGGGAFSHCREGGGVEGSMRNGENTEDM
jgi:hypothetical protein